MSSKNYLLGLDCGTSSIKATLLEISSGKAIVSATSPEKEMEIIAKQAGWAEQNPSEWWDNTCKAIGMMKQKSDVDFRDIAAIGISYQMHGLVCVDKDKNVLRPSIIWCDSRAVSYGQKAFEKLGDKRCLENLLNSPGNFTASKLAWVKENEPDIFKNIDKIMLPGDYIAMKLSGGDITTTPSAISEAVLWNFRSHELAGFMLDYFGFPHNIIPPVVPTFSIQSGVCKEVAAELGIEEATPVSYRGGDQPNNALSLNVLNPGEIAATAGTSGVVYGVSDSPDYDAQSRVNTFVHVNYSKESPRYGVLLCVNGCGILNSWLKHNFMTVGERGEDYRVMDRLSSEAPVGSDGLSILPFGNGAERTLGNASPGASFVNLDFNRHKKTHILRAAQEGIVFALNYGLDIMKKAGVDVETVRAGDANMFRGPVFREAFATLSGARVELYRTDGSAGAARGAGIGAGIYTQSSEAFSGLENSATIEPEENRAAAYRRAYERWLSALKRQLAK